MTHNRSSVYVRFLCGFNCTHKSVLYYYFWPAIHVCVCVCACVCLLHFHRSSMKHAVCELTLAKLWCTCEGELAVNNATIPVECCERLLGMLKPQASPCLPVTTEILHNNTCTPAVNSSLCHSLHTLTIEQQEQYCQGSGMQSVYTYQCL